MRSGNQGSRTGTQQPVAGPASQRAASPFVEPIGPAGDAYEREADRIADAVVRGDPVHGIAGGWATAANAAGTIQRACAKCEEEEEEQIRRAPRDGAAPEAAAPAATAPTPARQPEPAPAEKTDDPAARLPTRSLLVDDGGDARPSEMRKSEFLAALRGDVCAAVDEALKGSGRDSAGCPWIDHWFAYYEARSSVEIERSLYRYVPEARRATSAADYVPMVTSRIRRSAVIFAKTGEVTGLPADASTKAPGSSEVLGEFGGMFFKARSGGPRPAHPVSIRRQLGGGESLPGPVRTRMESAFGASFGGVRLHVDNTAAQLSDRLNARAFTIGEHVAFGGGEFRPGTIAGDALIAHELAHVVQQHGAARTAPAKPTDEARLEHDADRSAMAAVVQGGQGARGSIMPQLRSGLSLQRCSKPSPAIDLKAMTSEQWDVFIKTNFEAKDRKEARVILDDILASKDDLRFADLAELSTELHKRLSTARLMKKTQDLYGKAFEYPNHAAAKKCVGGRENPRVNKAAEQYWGPVQDAQGHYFFNLSAEGKKNPHQALVTLFTPQKSICDMTLIHCDYLVSVVHFRAFADQLGIDEFNRRVVAGDIEMVLRWNGFTGIQEGSAPNDKGVSLRQMRPSAEQDLVIGDHVIFWNHRAYDAINNRIGNAWRLENAVLIEKKKGDDLFLGHGSGRRTNSQMRAKLAEEFNDVVKIAIGLIKTIAKGGSGAASARASMAAKFPKIKEDAGRWQIESTHKKDFDVKEIKASDPDLTGLRDPDDPSKMYPVKRPVESE